MKNTIFIQENDFDTNINYLKEQEIIANELHSILINRLEEYAETLANIRCNCFSIFKAIHIQSNIASFIKNVRLYFYTPDLVKLLADEFSNQLITRVDFSEQSTQNETTNGSFFKQEIQSKKKYKIRFSDGN